MNKYLALPMFSMVLLTYAVAVVMLKARIQAVKSGHTKLSYFKTFSDSQPTDAMVKSAHHFVNLFELPVLFYAGCLAAMLVQVPGSGVLVWAWIFVASRIIHAIIHIGSNKVQYRMRAFMVGAISVMAIWIEVVSHVIRN